MLENSSRHIDEQLDDMVNLGHRKLVILPNIQSEPTKLCNRNGNERLSVSSIY